jgi:purine-cytosine permease-like protein
MSVRPAVLVAIVGSAFMGGYALVASSQSAASPRPTWEYQEVQLSSTASSLAVLNKLGAQGWELVNVVAGCTDDDNTYSTDDCRWWAYLKRRT